MFHRPIDTASRSCQTLDAALQARGFRVDDFRVEEESASDMAATLGIIGGVLRVKCRSTGEERFYATGTGSTWLGAFTMDLTRGHFADAARARSSGFIPLPVTIPAPLHA